MPGLFELDGPCFKWWRIFFAALDYVSVLKCSVQQHCVLILLSVCGAFSIIVRERTLCFSESTCQNTFLSPVAGCRMVVSDQRSQPTVGVQTPRRQSCRRRAHTQKVSVRLVWIFCLRSLGNDNLASLIYITVSRRNSEVKIQLKKQANVKDLVSSVLQMSVFVFHFEHNVFNSREVNCHKE